MLIDGWLMFKRISLATMMVALIGAVAAQAADLTGVPKILDGDEVSIGNTRIRLMGVDAPALEQLCLDAKGAPWKCGITARDELIRYAARKPGALLSLMTVPGLLLQRITTQPPDDAEVDVAIRSLNDAMELEAKQGGQLVIA